MGILEDAEKLAEKATGIGRPKQRDLADLVRQRKAATFRFADDGSVPNHPRWPLVHYRSPVRLTKSPDPAAIFEDLFERNGWGDSWRNGVYDYLHFHSRIHEVMGVARGTAVVQFGGTRGRKLRLKAGDVVVLPAGTGHQCLSASTDFLIVGAYPATGTYNICRTSPKEHDRALKTVPKVPAPRRDPVYGQRGDVPGMKPAIEPVIRIFPSSRSRICRPTAWSRWTVPVTLVSISWRMSSKF